MSIDTELAAKVKELIELEPSLADRLMESETVQQAAELAVEAAGRHGIAIETEAVANLLESAGAGQTGAELTEEQLAAVEGGVRPSTFLLDPKLERARRR